MSQSLADLDSELVQLLDLLDSEDPEDAAAAEAILNDLMPQLTGKIDSYAALIAHYDQTVGNIDVEIARLQTRKARKQAAQDRLRDRLQTFLETRVETLGAKGKTLEGSLYKVSLANNGGKQPLYINPVAAFNALDEPFLNKKIVTSFNKDKIREFMVEKGITELFGEDGIFVAELQPRGKHLKIS